MNRVMCAGMCAAPAVGATGCGGAGGWFITLVFLGLLIAILIKVFRESEATSDSLISIEGQLRRLNNKLEEMLDDGGGSGGSKTAKKSAKKTAKKTSTDS